MSVSTEQTLFGIAAVISALTGLATTILALRKSRNEEQEECLRRLRETRVESEQVAKELHALKVKYHED